MLPRVGPSSPVSKRNRVVFPEPLRPTMPHRWPGSTLNVTSEKRVVSPKSRPTPPKLIWLTRQGGRTDYQTEAWHNVARALRSPLPDRPRHLHHHTIALKAGWNAALGGHVGVRHHHLDAALAVAHPDGRAHDTGQRHERIAVRRENLVDTPGSHDGAAPLSLHARALGAGTGRQRAGHQHACDRACDHQLRLKIIEKPLLLPSGS